MPKENLVWKLDVLESQLREDGSDPRLYKTKFAADKIAKKDGFPKDKAAVLSQVNGLKRKLTDRKLHHGTQQIQKALKKAIAVESLKLQKRIKDNDGCDPTKLEVLQEELVSLKQFKALQISGLVAGKTIFKEFLSAKDGEPGFLSPKAIKDSRKYKQQIEIFNRAQQNVFSRLCDVKAVKSAVFQMIKAIKIAAGLEQKKTKADIKKTKKETEIKDVSKVHIDDDDVQRARIENENEGDEDNEDKIDDEGDENNEDRIDGEKHNNDLATRNETSGSEQEESFDGDDNFFESSELPNGLPSLATGYISGSDDDEDNYDYDNDETVKSITTERKNRRGQRARQKIWEMKYGSSANHIQKEKEEKIEKVKQRQTEFEKRQAKRAKRQMDDPHRKSETSKSTAKTDEKPIHPSWEAKKKLTATAVKFEGKKVRFD
jgi:hypothetical protein